MQITIIAAMSENRVIGRNNVLPWHVPEELKLFKAYTLNKPVLMGRKTFESIGKPLPKRENFILSQNKNFKLKAFPEIKILNNLEAAMHVAQSYPEFMIIGGAKIYELFLPLANRLILSTILKTVEGDTYFPEIQWENWQLQQETFYPEFVNRIYQRK